MQKAKALSLVENSVSSIFSRVDVIRLIDDIDTPSTFQLSDKFKEGLKNVIEQRIDSVRDTDCVDNESFEFKRDGNFVNVDDFKIDKSFLEEIIWNDISDFLRDYEEQA
ncbi:MAG: hypothetical protein ACOVNU_08045 [Candidatus Kapaibacteriota bacterium]